MRAIASSISTPTRRRRVAWGSFLAFASVLAISMPALAAAPAWRVDSISNTTAAPGSQVQYLLQLTNVGGTVGGPSMKCSSGLCTLEIDVPDGLTAVSWAAAAAGAVPLLTSCTNLGVPGPTSVLCTRPFGGGQAFGAHKSQQFVLTMQVDPSAIGTLTTRFAIFGGADTSAVPAVRTDGSACDAAPPGTPCATTADPIRVADTPPGFGVSAFDGQVASDPLGDPFTQAGGHPYSVSTAIDFNTLTNPNPFVGPLWPVEPAKDVLVDAPMGLVGYPPTAARCSAADLHGLFGGTTPEPLCSPTSQVGTTMVRINGLSSGGVVNTIGPIPVYNMVTPSDVPARFGFNVAGSVVTLDARVRNDHGVYGLTFAAPDVSEALPIAGTSVTLWGNPADPSHDSERGCSGVHEPFDPSVIGPSCSSGAPQAAFMRNPTSCEGSAPGADGLTATVHADSWTHPGPVDAGGNPLLEDPRWQSRSFISHLPPAYPEAPENWGPHQLPTGCEKVPFDPTLSASPAAPAKAGAPDGLVVDLNLPQSSDPSSVGESDLRAAKVTLPTGVRVSPSAASGLGGCSPDEIALGSNSDPACPDASKVGSLSITTPLLDRSLSGSVYLATPHDNPFDSLIAIYFVVKGPGVVLKLPGKIELDPTTGQITATFDNQPQLPFSNLHVEFFGGPRASVTMPDQCGTYTTHATLTGWSGKTVTSDSSFDLSADGNGAPCPPAGFSPDLKAGTLNAIAGTDSTFHLWLTRTDQDQQLSSLAVDTPGGLLGRIANAVLCPDAAASAGTCTDGSKIGDVTVGAGAGSNPFYITNGRAYLTGPYRGAPYGLSIVVPAVAGPFDLGTVVVRSAIYVDRRSAALKVVSDPLPTILQGIPLDVRDVRVAIDRPHFFVNPTSCAEKRIYATVGSTDGLIAHPSVRFQAAECANLSLAPKLTMTVGAAHRTKAGISTPVTTTLTQTPGQTNLRSVSVTLPASLNALLPVVNRACKLAEFEAGHCSSRARVGTAVAVTPLLRDPLRGSAYFVKNPARVLPDLMVALRGQVSLDLTGKVSIPGGKRLGTRFDTIPDAPITKFTLRIVAGTNGPVGIATNLCSARARAATASVGYRGQNGAVLRVNPHVRIAGCPRAAKARRARR